LIHIIDLTPWSIEAAGPCSLERMLDGTLTVSIARANEELQP
jgi:hypothetical protein